MPVEQKRSPLVGRTVRHPEDEREGIIQLVYQITEYHSGNTFRIAYVRPIGGGMEWEIDVDRQELRK